MQQSTLTSPSCYSSNNIETPLAADATFNKNRIQNQYNYLQKFKSTQELSYKINLLEENDYCLFKNSPSKLISQQYLDKSPLFEQQEIDEIASLSQKEIFNSIESIQLDKLDQSDNQSHKRSSPPPGFELQFQPDQTLIQDFTQSNLEKLSIKPSLTKPTQEQCKVIYIRGLDHPSLTLQSLYNIFSNFGMIIRMLFFRSKGALLLQFSSSQQALQCKEWMNCIVLCGNVIKIFDSNHQEIKQKQSILNAGEFWERDILCNERGKQTNPPSEVVHVANLRPEACSQEVILQVFSVFGFVQNIKFLLDDPQKKMCLVKYKTIEESLNAVAFLHGYWLYGR